MSTQTRSTPRHEESGASHLGGHHCDLLWKAGEAARAMAVSERTLWALTKSGRIPAVRIGRAVRYDPADLRAYIEASKCGGRA